MCTVRQKQVLQTVHQKSTNKQQQTKKHWMTQSITSAFIFSSHIKIFPKNDFFFLYLQFLKITFFFSENKNNKPFTFSFSSHSFFLASLLHLLTNQHTHTQKRAGEHRANTLTLVSQSI